MKRTAVMLPPLWDKRLPRKAIPSKNCMKWCATRCVVILATVFREKCLPSSGFIACGTKFLRRENSTGRSQRRFGQGLARFGLSISDSMKLPNGEHADLGTKLEDYSLN